MAERSMQVARLPTTRTAPFDPPPELGRLHAEGPLCRLRYPDGHVGWLVTGHALARQVLVDPRFSMHPSRPPVGEAEDNAAVSEATAELPEVSGVLIALDPPEHTRIRRMLTKHFTARRMAEHRAAIEQIVADRLDVMREAGSPADLVEAFALPVPSLAICQMLGVPGTDRGRFEKPQAIFEDPASSADAKSTAFREFCEYARGVIERKRAEPADDLLSALIETEDVTDDELAGIALQLFSAGHETTASMLALSTFLLLTDRRQWDRLCADESAIPAAVEELLRYLTIVQVGALTRTALEDVELPGGLISAGEAVTVSLSAANRDPDKFERPDVFDPQRHASGHVAFGYGRHMCLGQHLARVELDVGIAGLTRRFPGLRLAQPASEVEMNSGEQFLAGVRRLLVEW